MTATFNFNKINVLNAQIEELKKELRNEEKEVLKHFEDLMKHKISEDELLKQYKEIPESAVKYKVFRLFSSNGYFSDIIN